MIHCLVNYFPSCRVSENDGAQDGDGPDKGGKNVCNATMFSSCVKKHLSCSCNLTYFLPATRNFPELQ